MFREPCIIYPFTLVSYLQGIIREVRIPYNNLERGALCLLLYSHTFNYLVLEDVLQIRSK